MKKKRNKPASHPLPLPSMSVHSEKNQSLSSTSTSTSTFSSFSSTPSTFPSPSPSPSPYHFASFSVPFAWERKPGVPYTPLHPHHLAPTSRNFPLPLPPSKVYSLVDNNGNLATIRRRRRGLEFFLALISRLTGLDPYCSRKSVAVDEIANYEVPNTAVRASRRRHKR